MNRTKSKPFFCFAIRGIALLCILAVIDYAQAQTSISGIINKYAAVSSITDQDCTTSLSVDNPAAFHTGDTVLIMQMKGAVIDTSNTASFGNILSLNGAGHYEYGIISDVNGNLVSLSNPLATTFDSNGRVQMITVPNYNSVSTTGLTAKKWDGASGGVLVFFATGNVTLYGDINVSGLGFRGGDVSNNPDGDCGTGSHDFYYPLTQPGLTEWAVGGAKKGEGIAELNDDKMAGKGKLANGGGGGNKHNYGGGGGGNYTSGGQGGGALDGCGTTDLSPGGLDMSPYISANTLFMGGGGGCGDFNNAVGSIGADGGGIVIIRAAGLIGNGHSIRADGKDEPIIGSGIADGVGGGGAGGTIYLDVANINTPLTLSVNGGNGGDQNPSYCVGTGGGGGVGAILLPTSTVPADVTIIDTPGRAGFFLNTYFVNCAGTSYFATAGAPTNKTSLTGVSHISSIINECECKLVTPDAFTPNGDSKNEKFGILSKCPIRTFAMDIYNRHGQLVFKGHNLSDQWDGNFNGVAQPSEVYVYFITYTDPYANKQKSVTGSLTLLR